MFSVIFLFYSNLYLNLKGNQWGAMCYHLRVYFIFVQFLSGFVRSTKRSTGFTALWSIRNHSTRQAIKQLTLNKIVPGCQPFGFSLPVDFGCQAIKETFLTLTNHRFVVTFICQLPSSSSYNFIASLRRICWGSTFWGWSMMQFLAIVLLFSDAVGECGVPLLRWKQRLPLVDNHDVE